MTAKKGTNSFTTPESNLSEKTNKEIFHNVLSLEEFKEFSIKESYNINEVYKTSLASNKTGKPSDCEPDFGIVYYKNRPVALGENKYQSNMQNVVERVNLLLPDALKLGIDLKNVFIVFDGPAFKKDNHGNYHGAPGKQVVRSKEFHTVMVNPKKEDLYDEVYKFFTRIKKELS